MSLVVSSGTGTGYAGLGKDGVAEAVIAVGVEVWRDARDVAFNVIRVVVHDIAGQESYKNLLITVVPTPGVISH